MNFYTEIRNDFASVLSEWKMVVTIVRPSPTQASYGETTTSTQTSYIINCIMQPITTRDRDINSMGLALPGNKKCFFKYQYNSDDDPNISGTFTPELGDIITDVNNVSWRIETIMKDPMQQDNIVFLKAIIRRLA